MIEPIRRRISGRRAGRIAAQLRPWISEGDRVLDFGCGNLLVGEALRRWLRVEVLGVDVIDINLTDLPLLSYDGRHIPLDEASVDVTYAAFVLHHTEDPEAALAECIRVTRRRLIVLEEIYRNDFELLLTKALDYANKLHALSMPLPLNFRKEEEWLTLFVQFGLRIVEVGRIRSVPLRPTRLRRFVLDLPGRGVPAPPGATKFSTTATPVG